MVNGMPCEAAWEERGFQKEGGDDRAKSCQIDAAHTAHGPHSESGQGILLLLNWPHLSAGLHLVRKAGILGQGLRELSRQEGQQASEGKRQGGRHPTMSYTKTGFRLFIAGGLAFLAHSAYSTIQCWTTTLPLPSATLGALASLPLPCPFKLARALLPSGPDHHHQADAPLSFAQTTSTCAWSARSTRDRLPTFSWR